jgi:hypothetical protein
MGVALTGRSEPQYTADHATRAANLIFGRAAYETARRLVPNDRVDYRDGARIICPQRSIIAG